MGPLLWGGEELPKGVTPGHWRGRGWGVGENPPPDIPKHCRCPLAASPLVTMHDLKQGLAPSRMISARRSASNNYKLKVGVP